MIYRLFKRIFLVGVITCTLIGWFGLTAPEAAWADSAGTSTKAGIQLSLEDAVNRALTNSYALRMAKYNVEQGEENRNVAASKVDFTPLSGGNEEASRAFINLVQKDISLSMSKKSLDMEQDSLVLEVYQTYCDVLTAQGKVKSQKVALDYARYKLLAAQAGVAAGTSSRKSLDAAEVSYSNQVSGFNQSQITLEQCFIKLNELLGISGQERPILTDDLEYSPLDITDLDLEITRRMDTNPTLWRAKQSVYLAELSLSLHTYTDINTYNSTKIDVSKAELSAVQTRQQVRQNMRTMYDHICNLQEQYNQQQQALRLAENELEAVQLKYEMGLIPKGDVLAAEVDLANKNQALKSLIYQHQLLRMNFDKPWA